MKNPMEITIRDIELSPEALALVDEKVEQLLALSHRITGCRVVIEQPHRHHRKGRHFHVTVEVMIPGDVVVVSRDPVSAQSHSALQATLSEVFGAARRQLQRRLRSKGHRRPQEISAPWFYREQPSAA